MCWLFDKLNSIHFGVQVTFTLIATFCVKGFVFNYKLKMIFNHIKLYLLYVFIRDIKLSILTNMSFLIKFNNAKITNNFCRNIYQIYLIRCMLANPIIQTEIHNYIFCKRYLMNDIPYIHINMIFYHPVA